MYHIVYLITNLVNNKIYVGVHSTYNLEDGYLGSGTLIKKAIRRYGKSKFNKQILYYCLTEYDAFLIEKNIVNRHFISRKDTYNIVIGGGIERLGQKNPGSKTNTSSEKLKEKGQKVSQTRIAKGIAKGQNNNGSSSKMSKEKRHEKALKTAKIRKENGSYIVSEAKKQLNKLQFTNVPVTKYKIYDPNKNEYIIFGKKNFKEFCYQHSLSVKYMFEYVNKGIINIQEYFKIKKQVKNCNNWNVIREKIKRVSSLI